MAERDISHEAISSYFIGPKAENLQLFRDNIDIILDELKTARLNYYPEDEKLITEDIQASDEFQRITNNFSQAVRTAAKLLGKHSIPFWSPRYEAHMATDMTMPALLGYFMTMIYNPNNVALEASPLTTIAEIEVGEQMCRLFGYNTDTRRDDVPVGWAHLTSGGTVANLESMWVARNLKFYPLALHRAIVEGELNFISDELKVQTCIGEEKLFKDLTVWELLNLRPSTVLDLPQMLNEEFGISPKFVEECLKRYNIQSSGKDTLETHFEIDKPIQYMIGKARHYSWPKAGAVLGVGSDNIVGVEVDDGARICLDDLESKLEQSLENKQAVYAVVAVIGSTEEGAVDRLSRILAIRQRFQSKGLSFLVHADAAWGGYFATMLPRDLMDMPSESSLVDIGEAADTATDGMVPDLSLKAETQEDLLALKYADSITVDPHKAGYIPYPSGVLAYRDGRMRYLVTWTAPVLSQGVEGGIGIYGIEGSKPGAAAMSTWLSNKCIGLNPTGYGALLSEVSFTCTRFSAYWAAMTSEKDSFICVPFNMLPSELKPNSTRKDVEEEKKRIRTEILNRSNKEIVEYDKDKPEEAKTMKLLRSLGSDLNINAFALNWRFMLPDGSPGELNDDVEEANYLMRRVVERLSVDSPDDDPTKIPFYLTSTEFTPELYGSCAETFKKRLGLKDRKESPQSLFVLRNVVMSPFSSQSDFMGSMIKTFRKVVEEEVEVCLKRNNRGPAIHSFIMQGHEEIFLVYQPSFHLAKHRRQLILAVQLEKDDVEVYRQIKKTTPRSPVILQTYAELSLDDLLNELTAKKEASFRAKVFNNNGLLLPSIKVHIRRIVKDRTLASIYRDATYPQGEMPFYLYGTETEHHLAHMLLRAPNISLLAGDVKLDLNENISAEELARGTILSLTNIHEASRQPFPSKNSELGRNFFFRSGQTFPVSIWRDPMAARQPAQGTLTTDSPLLATGKITLGTDVQVDVDGVNRDMFKRVEKVNRWRDKFNEIGQPLGS
ncbi:hypothetical protein FQN57_000364 [Myotisia sp. PD_48]|nr:hypothetical protein FQN57_000364 [Myotisia sp. PD_48]